MQFTTQFGGLLVIVLAVPVARAGDPTPAAEMSSLKKELRAAWDDLKPGATAAEDDQARERYLVHAASLARRALALAKAHPHASEAPEALAWLLFRIPGGYSAKWNAERDAAYDLIAERYLDRDAILPVCRRAWNHALNTTHAEAFLRAAFARSSNRNIRALACFSLGRHQQELARTVYRLHHPIPGNKPDETPGVENPVPIQMLSFEHLRRDAEAFFERTVREFADVQPTGEDSAPLGNQAEGALFRLRNLEVGCLAPEIEGRDFDEKSMKLSDFRGKVVVVSFWAVWCGPCMGMVPAEKALVDRMKGRPFVLVGVNGDPDRGRARSTSIKEGINWRSFWDGGQAGKTSVKWGVSEWPTVYLIDAKGVIRDCQNGPGFESAAEALVSETEAAKRP